MFKEYDLALLEINPLVVTGEGNLTLSRRQNQHRQQRNVYRQPEAP